MTNHDLQKFLAFVAEHTGLELNQSRQKSLVGTIDSWAQSSSLGDLMAQLAEKPVSDPAWQKIIHAMTIGETYFFRNQYHFRVLREQILPELIEKRRESGLLHLRIWCAGCSTGEEPYSIAILLHELIPDIQKWSITLLATDINQQYIEQAKRGVFKKGSFRNETPASVRDEWFTPVADGSQISTTIKRKVSFATLNLVSDDYPSYANNTTHMDLIICRNVTIYFDTATTKNIAKRFRQALTRDGWLLVGHSEPNMQIYHDFTVRNFENAIFYQNVPTTGQLDRPVTHPLRPAKMATILKKVEERKKPAPPVARQQKKPRPIPKPETQQNYLEQARQAANTQQWDKTLQLLIEAERYDNLNPYIHYLRGLVYQQTNQLDDAIAALKRALYCDAQFALGHYMLGDLLLRTNNRKRAIQHWRSALQALANHEADYELPLSDGLTVEMLNELIQYRLK